MILIGTSVYFIYGVFLWCPPCRANMGDPRYRVLQYVNGSFMVVGVSDKSTDPSLAVIAYEIKRT